jgi:hypothetical protein
LKIPIKLIARFTRIIMIKIHPNRFLILISSRKSVNKKQHQRHTRNVNSFINSILLKYYVSKGFTCKKKAREKEGKRNRRH